MSDTQASREQAVLQAILAEPDCDEHRLVYADLLEERGNDARAELIRLQIAIHREFGLPEYADSQQLKAMDRERELLEHGVNNWLPIPGYVWFISYESGVCVGGTRVSNYKAQSPKYLFKFRRGFIEWIGDITAEDWLAHADAITACQPVQEVTLTSMPNIHYRPVGVGVALWLNGKESRRSISISSWNDYVVGGFGVLAQTLLHDYWPRIDFTLPPS